MSGLMNKVKDALHGTKNNPSNTSNNNNNNTYNNNNGTAPTNPSILHSTQPGIHSQRDSGTGLTSSHADTDAIAASTTSGRTLGSSTKGPGLTPTNTRATTTSDDIAGGASGAPGAQLTGDTIRDADLVGSGLTDSGARTEDTGAGSGLDGGDRRGVRDEGEFEEGSGLGAGMGESGGGGRGEGLVDERQRLDASDEVDGSGLSGSGGLGGGQGGYRGDDGVGAGAGLTGAGVGGGVEGVQQQGQGRHYRSDGHPEDILHPGPHVTGTAKALDPHLD